MSCSLKTGTSVYENFSREYLAKILSGNVCNNCTLQNIKYVRCGYFLIIGKLIIFRDFLRQKEFQISQWFTRCMGLNVPSFLSPSFWYNVLDLKSFVFTVFVLVCTVYTSGGTRFSQTRVIPGSYISINIRYPGN